MKTYSILLSAFLLLPPLAFAQEKPTSAPETTTATTAETPASEATIHAAPATDATLAEPDQPPQAVVPPPPDIRKPTVIYSGFFVELSRASDKKRFLSLRQPANPVRDTKTVFFDQRTNEPKGFVLFSLDF